MLILLQMHERIRTLYDTLQKGTIAVLAVSVLLVSLQYSLIWYGLRNKNFFIWDSLCGFGFSVHVVLYIIMKI